MQDALASIHKVLVVVPDRELRRSIEFALAAEGFAIGAHEGFEAALASADADRSDCAVIDENALVPGAAANVPLEGIARPVVLLVDRLREVPRTSGIRVLTKPLLGRRLVETVACAIADGRPASRLRSFP